MKKVAWWHPVPQNQLQDIIKDESMQLRFKFDEVLRLAVEQYLGRYFNPELDAKRIELQIIQGNDKTNVLIDGLLIGSIRQFVDYNNDDFIQNNITIAIVFTPNIELIHHNENNIHTATS